MTTKKGRVRLSPRISVNKLGEYLLARRARARSILGNQKRPSDFIVTKYRVARAELTKAFETSNHTPQQIAQIINVLQSTPTTAKNADEIRLSCAALKSFMSITGIPSLKGMTLVRGSNTCPKLHIENVDISVRPDLVMRGTIRGKECVGVIKFHISKSHPLGQEAGSYITTLLHQYAEDHIAGRDDQASLRYCLLIDVFDQNVYTAPRSYLRRRKDIRAGCKEIQALWAGI